MVRKYAKIAEMLTLLAANTKGSSVLWDAL